jgi:hypothetical protein
MLNIANNWISKLPPINKLIKKETKIDQIHFENPYNILPKVGVPSFPLIMKSTPRFD